MGTDPVLIAYTARKTSKGKAVWSRIGEAYPHSTGAGLTIKLHAAPLDGVIILLELDESDHRRLEQRAAQTVARDQASQLITRPKPQRVSIEKPRVLSASPNEIRLARRLLKERQDHDFSPNQLAALQAVVDSEEKHSVLTVRDMECVRRIFRSL